MTVQKLCYHLNSSAMTHYTSLKVALLDTSNKARLQHTTKICLWSKQYNYLFNASYLMYRSLFHSDMREVNIIKIITEFSLYPIPCSNQVKMCENTINFIHHPKTTFEISIRDYIYSTPIKPMPICDLCEIAWNKSTCNVCHQFGSCENCKQNTICIKCSYNVTQCNGTNCSVKCCHNCKKRHAKYVICNGGFCNQCYTNDKLKCDSCQDKLCEKCVKQCVNKNCKNPFQIMCRKCFSTDQCKACNINQCNICIEKAMKRCSCGELVHCGFQYCHYCQKRVCKKHFTQCCGQLLCNECIITQVCVDCKCELLVCNLCGIFDGMVGDYCEKCFCASYRHISLK